MPARGVFNLGDKMNFCAINRYATAYFTVVHESKAFLPVATDLKLLKSLFEKYRAVFERFDCPTLSAKSRVLFVQKLFVENKFNKITKNLLRVLAEYGCLKMLGSTIDAYWKLYLEFQKELVIEVISVKKLKNDDVDYIKNFFKREYERKIIVQNTLNESILGGFVIKINSFVLDGSVANRLKSFEFTLKNESQ